MNGKYLNWLISSNEATKYSTRLRLVETLVTLNTDPEPYQSKSSSNKTKSNLG